MTDRELLELAAKAAGIRGSKCEWNPLTDDGDALRLMVKLEIGVNPYAGKVVVWNEEQRIGGHEKWDSDEDACEATRRAIVRAAAQIEKEKNNGQEAQ